MNKQILKRIFVMAGTTYLALAIAYAIGYASYTGGSWFSFGPHFGGVVLVYLAAAPTVIISIIVIIGKKENTLKVLVGYLILTVGISSLAIGIYTENEQRNAHIRYQQYLEQQNWTRDERTSNTIAPIIREIYPNVQFYVDSWDRTVVKLDGYSYHQQPDFDAELTIWQELSIHPTFINYPHEISVAYYFADMPHSFADFNLRDFNLQFSALGISDEGIAYWKPILYEYARNFYDDFNIDTVTFRGVLNVVIYHELSAEEMPAEAERWLNFVKINNINTELVAIAIQYRAEKGSVRSTIFEPHSNKWFDR